MSLLWRSLKIVAVALGVLLGLVAVAAASVYAYGEAESNRATSLPGPTGPYAVAGSPTTGPTARASRPSLRRRGTSGS